MSNIVEFPVTAASMSDEELGFQMAGSIDKLMITNKDLMIDVACYRSLWVSVQLRLSSYQVRRLRFTILGAVAGALVAWCLDGSAAQKINALLDLVGWHA